jgi:RNA polymerase sigma factor (sigma-70 family)
MTDSQLLAEYLHARSQEAFAVLVERYGRLVYSACRRRLGNSALAEDATQTVFMLLARKAGKLQHKQLSGWLLTAARLTCANMRRKEQRMKQRETMSGMQVDDVDHSSDAELLAMLDDGLLQLRASDRTALMLRFFQEQPWKEVGEALGLTDDAARKKVERAMDRLRGFFAERGVQMDSAALAVFLSTRVNQLMPAKLPIRIVHGWAAAPVAAVPIGASVLVASAMGVSGLLGVAGYSVVHKSAAPVIPSPPRIVAAATKPVYSDAERQRRTQKAILCQRNMHLIGQAILAYANKHNGHFPGDAGSLIINEEISPQLFICPSSGMRMPAEILDADSEVQAEWVDQHSDYLYVGQGKNINGSPDAIVLYEKDSAHEGRGMNILFADGHVDFNSPLSVAHQVIEKAPKK